MLLRARYSFVSVVIWKSDAGTDRSSFSEADSFCNLIHKEKEEKTILL